MFILLQYFYFVFESWKLLLLQQPLLILFYCIVVPSKVFDSKVSTRFELLRRNRFLSVTNLGCFLCRKIRKYANLRACSSDMYATFIRFEFSDLSNGSTCLKFVFTGCSVLADFVSVFLHCLLWTLSKAF